MCRWQWQWWWWWQNLAPLAEKILVAEAQVSFTTSSTTTTTPTTTTTLHRTLSTCRELDSAASIHGTFVWLHGCPFVYLSIYLPSQLASWLFTDMHMYICMIYIYIYLYVCVYTYKYTHTHKYKYIYIYTHIPTYICSYMCVYICMRVCCMHAWTYMNMCLCVYTWR